MIEALARSIWGTWMLQVFGPSAVTKSWVLVHGVLISIQVFVPAGKTHTLSHLCFSMFPRSARVTFAALSQVLF